MLCSLFATAFTYCVQTEKSKVVSSCHYFESTLKGINPYGKYNNLLMDRLKITEEIHLTIRTKMEEGCFQSVRL